jgi:hypothetical protein
MTATNKPVLRADWVRMCRGQTQATDLTGAVCTARLGEFCHGVRGGDGIASAVQARRWPAGVSAASTPRSMVNALLLSNPVAGINQRGTRRAAQ